MNGLTMHTGRKFQQVTTLDLMNAPTPAATRTWCPISHGWLLNEAVTAIEARGFRVRTSDLRMTPDGKEFFGMLRIERQVPEVNTPPNWGLSVGLRNTNNKRASAAVLLGTNVWLCDNLAFSADYSLVRKHHPHSYDILKTGIGGIMDNLPQYMQERERVVSKMQKFYPCPEVVSHTLVRAAQQGAILVGDILKITEAFQNPNQENPEAAEPNLWGLYNAATFVGRGYFLKNPETAAQRSIALTRLFEEVAP